MNINTDPGCGRTMDPDIVFGSNPGLDVTMSSVGNAGHPNWHGSRWQPRPLASAWPMLSGVMGISTDSACGILMLLSGTLICDRGAGGSYFEKPGMSDKPGLTHLQGPLVLMAPPSLSGFHPLPVAESSHNNT